MNTYLRQRNNKTVKVKTYEITLLIAVIGCLLALFFAVKYYTGSTSDVVIVDRFIEQAKVEEQNVREYALQLSRIGGSNTVHTMAKVRQHLYALELINELSVKLLASDGALVPPEAISGAISALNKAEEQVLGAQTIDKELSTLWEEINYITESLE